MGSCLIVVVDDDVCSDYQSTSPVGKQQLSGPSPFQSRGPSPAQSKGSSPSQQQSADETPMRRMDTAATARVPLLGKLVLLAAVMLVVYVILHNMEPAYTPPALRGADESQQ